MDKKLSIETRMEKEDYKKFLYSVTFFKSVKSIVVLVAIALIAAVLLTVNGTGFNIVKFLGYFVLLLFVGAISIVLKIEKLNKTRIKNNKELFESVNTLDFYDDCIEIGNTSIEDKNKIAYEIISKVGQTKEFYLIYLNNNQALVIRKKDINENEERILKEILKDKLSDKKISW